jgi:hypothetical protein
MIGHELRKAERVRVFLDTVWNVGTESHSGVIRNISLSGCFVSTLEPINLRDVVEVDVNAPAILRMTVRGAVVHRINGRGFAIRFGEMKVTEQNLLKLLLRMMKERESATSVSHVS